MLDKKIMFFWGNKTMSWLRYMTLVSFKRLNPDWKVELYLAPCLTTKKTWKDHNEQDFSSFTGVNYMSAVHKLDIEIKEWPLPVNLPNIAPSHLSNFFKWSKLATEGGIYADLDILWTKPIDSFYEAVKNVDVGICSTKFFSIGLLSSSPNNVVYNKIYETAKITYTPVHYQCAGVYALYMWLYGADIFEGDNIWNALAAHDIWSDLTKSAQDLTYYNIPMNLIYAYDSTRVWDIFKEMIQKFQLPEGAIGIHWYAGHPIAQELNNTLNASNWKKYDCLLTRSIT